MTNEWWKRDETFACDQRRDPRYVTLLRVGLLESPAGRELCLIKNLSRGGLRAQAVSTFDTGTRAAIEIRNGHSLAGTVRWSEHDHFGFHFDEPVDVESLLANPHIAANGLRARKPRIGIHRHAMVRSGARLRTGTAVDISQGGVKIALAGLCEGEQVVISMPGLEPLHGVVIWSDGRFTGIAFNQLIPFGRLAEWTSPKGAEAEAPGAPQLDSGLAGTGSEGAAARVA